MKLPTKSKQNEGSAEMTKKMRVATPPQKVVSSNQPSSSGEQTVTQTSANKDNHAPCFEAIAALLEIQKKLVQKVTDIHNLLIEQGKMEHDSFDSLKLSIEYLTVVFKDYLDSQKLVPLKKNDS